MAGITSTIQQNVKQAIVEMNDSHKERGAVVHTAWVALIGNLHHLQVGPGGTGKSRLVRDIAKRIAGAQYFETALDETSDPSQVLGPPDIKAMVEDGKTRRVLDGMFAEAHIAFVDEFFNGNGPTLHSIMPGLNERIIHNNGQPSDIPLLSMFGGTNKLNADTDMAALWDRIHIRVPVKYVADRENLSSLVRAQMALRGGGAAPALTGITLEELRQATLEAYNLELPDDVEDLFYDIKDQLEQEKGIVVGTRRIVEGMAGVHANAWVNGHDVIKPGDLDILQYMWWQLQDQVPDAREVVLAATNPGEKAALDLLDDLDKLRADLKQADNADLDNMKKNSLGVQIFRDSETLLEEAQKLLDQANASGAGTTRITELIDKTKNLQGEVGQKIFGLKNADLSALAGARP